MNNNILKAYVPGLELFRIQEPMNGREWADKYFYLSPESSGVEGKWETYPYQIGPLNWMCNDDVEEYNEQKSRRVGYTKRVLIATGYYVEHKRRNIAIWQPTDGDMKRFSKVEISPMLRDVKVLGNLLKCDVDSKNKYNTTELKCFVGSTLDLKGGKSGKSYRAMTKDVAIYDELAAFDEDIGKEGSPTALGDGRLDDSSFPKSIRGSTPTIKGPCLIEAEIKKCKFVFYRFLPCPGCGHLHRLEFKNLKWVDSDPETAYFACPKNACVFYYSDYKSMDIRGRWQTLDGYYYRDDTDSFYDPFDEPMPIPRRIGVKLWAAYSYFRTWSYVAEKWIEATTESKIGNKSLLKSVINTLLGETYEEKGESIDSTGFSDRQEDYHPDVSIPNDVLLITFGADVQGGKNPRLEVEILGHGLDDETWSIDYLVIKGDAEQQAVWDHLDDAVLRTFKRDDGVELRVSGGFVDSGYLATQVYKYTGPRRRRNIYATKGVNTGTLCNKGTWQGEKNKGRAILHTVNVDDAKTIIFNRLSKITEHGPGYCHFPSHYPEQHFIQLTNEEKKEKKKAGRLVGYEWIKLGPNEQLDTRAYNLGAFARLNPNLARMKMRLDAEAERIKSNIQGPLPRKSGRRVRSSGLR